jgi:hypothetical protein
MSCNIAYALLGTLNIVDSSLSNDGAAFPPIRLAALPAA